MTETDAASEKSYKSNVPKAMVNIQHSFIMNIYVLPPIVEAEWLALPFLIRLCVRFKSKAQGPAFRTEAFRGVPQFLHANIGPTSNLATIASRSNLLFIIII
jgi:hypothetical protein